MMAMHRLTYTMEGNPAGLLYLLSFSTPFNTSEDISTVFTTSPKDGGDANNIAPNYIDGTMMANDFEWFTYGGQLFNTETFEPPANNSVATWEKYPSGPPGSFQPGYSLDVLPDTTSRYVTYGGGVSVPSENLGFYFAGMRSPSGGPIYYLPGPSAENQSANADVNSMTLIQLNMTVQQNETWNNYTLPSTVPGRASPEIAWVPVSEQGVLVAIGGVLDPAYATATQANNKTINAYSVSLLVEALISSDKSTGTIQSCLYDNRICVRYRQWSVVRTAYIW